MSATVITGVDVVLPDSVLAGGSLVVEDGRLVAIERRAVDGPAGSVRLDGRGLIAAPGFVDVHVHGIGGVDVLDGPGSVAAVAALLPAFGVTAFCPTSIACPPETLDGFLRDVASARAASPAGSAQVLPAHLESNFINEDYRGAQPLRCLRTPAAGPAPHAGGAFDAASILRVIAARRPDVGIVTMAPELDGGMDLLVRLVAAGHRVSLGHTGASYDAARAAIAAGARHATHLFNRMSAFAPRAPGVPGAVLDAGEVAAEIICDGFHVHPALVRLALAAKGTDKVLAITDGTAAAGLPVGARARLGGQPIVVTPRSAELEDGTIAGSVLTMDRAFRMLVEVAEVPIVHAARMCATTPAREMGLTGTGTLTPGAAADIVLLDPDGWRVRQTFISGRAALEPRPPGPRLSS